MLSAYSLIVGFFLTLAGLLWFYFKASPKPRHRWLDNLLIVAIFVIAAWFAYTMTFNPPWSPDICIDNQAQHTC